MRERAVGDGGAPGRFDENSVSRPLHWTQKKSTTKVGKQTCRNTVRQDCRICEKGRAAIISSHCGCSVRPFEARQQQFSGAAIMLEHYTRKSNDTAHEIEEGLGLHLLDLPVFARSVPPCGALSRCLFSCSPPPLAVQHT